MTSRILMRTLTVLVLALLWTGGGSANVQQTVKKGDRVVLPCPVTVQARNFAVSWSKVTGTGEKADLRLSDRSGRVQLAEDKVSLVISSVMVQDAGRYDCRVGLPQKQDMVDSVQLSVLAPPSAPQLFLQVPPNHTMKRWYLLCVIKGFYPGNLTLRWTWSSTEDRTTPASVSCPVKAANRDDNKLQIHKEGSHTGTDDLYPHRCFSGPDGLGPEMQFTSSLSLPSRRAARADVKFTCSVEDHPALDITLSTSFDWQAEPNEVIGCLNIMKMAILSGTCVLLVILEIVLCCGRRAKYSKMEASY